MGYCVDMEVSVKIPLKKEKDIKKIFKDLAKKEEKIGSGYSGGKRFAFVSSGFADCNSVEEMFECWRYSVRQDETYFIVESFDGQKLGDDSTFWKHFEKIVTTDSFIELSGEDGTHFKWSFKDGKFKETYGTVVYNEED